MYRVYSAERSTHGYPISQNLAADPIGIKLNGVLGIRLRFEDNRWPDMYDIRELVVHSTTDFSGLAYGTVKDTSGNLVPEAVVQVGGPTSNILLITDATGSWSFPLDPGSYQLYADAPGHVGRLISFQVPGDGTPYSKDIILPAKSEPGLYNGDFEIASIQDDRKPDGWELFIQTGGNSDMYRYGRATYDNTTPGGSACGYLQVGTRNQSLPYWKEGWMKPLNTHWIPVNPNSTYNFYFKAKKTGYAASFWRLVWRRANGSEIRSVISPGWYWIPPDNWSRVFEGDFSGKKPMVRMTPPTVLPGLKSILVFTDWPSDDVGRGGTTFVDDIIADEFQSSGGSCKDIGFTSDSRWSIRNNPQRADYCSSRLWNPENGLHRGVGQVKWYRIDLSNSTIGQLKQGTLLQLQDSSRRLGMGKIHPCYRYAAGCC